MTYSNFGIFYGVASFFPLVQGVIAEAFNLRNVALGSPDSTKRRILDNEKTGIFPILLVWWMFGLTKVTKRPWEEVRILSRLLEPS